MRKQCGSLKWLEEIAKGTGDLGSLQRRLIGVGGEVDHRRIDTGLDRVSRRDATEFVILAVAHLCPQHDHSGRTNA